MFGKTDQDLDGSFLEESLSNARRKSGTEKGVWFWCVVNGKNNYVSSKHCLKCLMSVNDSMHSLFYVFRVGLLYTVRVNLYQVPGTTSCRPDPTRRPSQNYNSKYSSFTRSRRQ
jgi:hypothetical protein